MDLFIAILKKEKLPIPETEFKFCVTRKWRFDFAWPDKKIAAECDGGIWSRGRHGRGSGIIKDMEKMNNAVLLGWRVLHYTPDQMTTSAIDDLKNILSQ